MASDLIIVSVCQQRETGRKAKSAALAKERMISAARTYGRIDLHAPKTTHNYRRQPNNHSVNQTSSDKFLPETHLNIQKLRNQSRQGLLSLTRALSKEVCG
jgi:hypothetical protein